MWPLLQIAAYGSFDALLGVGVDGPAREAIQQEIPDLHLVEDVGHDGQQFYVISRHPFDPEASEGAVTPLAYRYRRIVFPLIGSFLAPNGGHWLIAVFLLQSLAGVALGAWALTQFPKSPKWLPLTMAFTPGVVAALGWSLSDALACGLGLLSVALAMQRRWWPAIGVVTAAVLTRETLLIVAVGLAFTPQMPRITRVLTMAIPTLVFGAWTIWVAVASGESASKGGADQMSAPFGGWMSSHVAWNQRAMLLTALLLLAAGSYKALRHAPQVAVICGLGALMLVCLSDLVAFHWINSMRPIAPMVPLAIWAITLADQEEGEGTVQCDSRQC